MRQLLFCCILLLEVIQVLWGSVTPADFPIYTGCILPQPKSVRYESWHIPLDSFRIVPDEGAHSRYLRRRLEARGGHCSPDGAVTIGLSLGKPLGNLGVSSHAEGYRIAMDRQGIRITGHDSLGLLWGIVSLIQMTHVDDGRRLQLTGFQADDWPTYECRGNASYAGKRNWLEFAATFKFNHVYRLGGMRDGENCNEKWLQRGPSAAWISSVMDYADYSAMGIKWCLGPLFLGGQKFAVSDPHAYARLMAWFEPVARAGGRALVMFDDTRFPVKDADLAKFGSAARADVWFLEKLYADMKRLDSRSGVVFCPPFYWGPDSNPSKQYGEDRDSYLRALGALPGEIEIMYTGRQVFGGKVARAEVEWFSSLIRRRPTFHMNDKDTPHMYGYHYGYDPVRTVNWHYEGFYRDVRFFNPGEYTMSAAEAQYFWNPGKYDGEKAPLASLAMMVGAGNVDLVRRLGAAFSLIDPYELKVTPGAIRHAALAVEAWKQAEEVMEEAKERGVYEAIRHWTVTGGHYPRLKGYALVLQEKNRKGLGNVDNTAFMTLAYRECGWRTPQPLLTAADFSGGITPDVYRWKQPDPRYCTGVRGKRSSNPVISAGFKLPTLEGRHYQLTIMGQDDDMEGACEVKIEINGRQIFNGKNPCQPFVWSKWSLPIPGGVLKEGENAIRIISESDDGRQNGGRFMLLNYAVIQ